MTTNETRKVGIGKLPDDIVRAICECLRVEPSPHNGQNKSNTQTDIRSLLDTCTRMRELKLSEVGMWHFTREYSRQYVDEEAFRARVHDALAMPDRDGGNPQQQQQLPISLDLWCSNTRDVSALGNVHTLDLSRCAGITDVSALSNVHALNLYECTGITDVSALGNVHTLDMSYCTGITDVSALGSVHILNLSY